MEQQNTETKRNFADRYASGLKASVHNNAIVYGFSIMITAALAVLQAGRDTVGILEVLAFAGGAVFAFTLVEAFIYLACATQTGGGGYGGEAVRERLQLPIYR